MRFIMSAAAVIVAMSATPSFARDYPWCARTSSNSFDGGCDFTTFAQCQATVSGQAGECQLNPIVAFEQQNRKSGRRTYSSPR
ncbi:hypothetical protein BH11PSE4_BH11PSE4_25570 [soil metagenome]